MAPYAIAHLKIGLKLYETGYRFGSEERARIYLTNALEPASDKQLTLDFLPALAHESQAVNEIKRKQRFTIVIGNPPYSKHSVNRGEWIDQLMRTYKEDVRGEQNIQPLSDDYIKFVRLAHDQIERAGDGVIGLVTNHSYVSGLVHRGVRRQLIHSFPDIRVLELHGDSNRGDVCPDGSKDENVFDIQQGVAIILAARPPLKESPAVYHYDTWGLQPTKYAWLTSHDTASTPWSLLSPTPPHYAFQPRAGGLSQEYHTLRSVVDIFGVYAAGFVTSLDETAIHFSREAMRDALYEFNRREPKNVRERAARKDLRQCGVTVRA
jgi:predicted helicase